MLHMYVLHGIEYKMGMKVCTTTTTAAAPVSSNKCTSYLIQCDSQCRRFKKQKREKMIRNTENVIKKRGRDSEIKRVHAYLLKQFTLILKSHITYSRSLEYVWAFHLFLTFSPFLLHHRTHAKWTVFMFLLFQIYDKIKDDITFKRVQCSQI